ncbi:MAG TPA: Ig-like domain-containing protein [Nitrososphaeraceae archaeon]
MAILFVTVSLLIVPDLTHIPVSGQADKSFKGTIAPFVPPSSSERLGSLPGNNFEFDDEEIEGDQEAEEEEEIDRDELPVLTKQERDEFLSDNIDAIEADRLTVLSQEETIDDDIDPISSVVEEIVKNETLIGDEEFVPSPESSIIKFKDENLEQILDAQEVAPEPDNQTISTSEEGGLPLNVTEDDFEIEQADEISESESPDVEVQSFINETTNEEATTAPPTDNETAITTEEDTDPEAGDEIQDIKGEEQTEQAQQEEATAPTDNETAITTEEDTVEGKPSELIEMDPEAGEEIQDIKGEEQTEQAQQEEEDEAQTPQVEEEAPNTEPTAQDGSVITSQNQQLNIKLNAKDADGDNLSFTIVDDPSNGQLGNVNPSTNTVTYTPDEDYSGEDNFTFIVNDGTIDSNEATVSISVEEEEGGGGEEQTEQAQQDEEEDSQQEEEE